MCRDAFEHIKNYAKSGMIQLQITLFSTFMLTKLVLGFTDISYVMGAIYMLLCIVVSIWQALNCYATDPYIELPPPEVAKILALKPNEPAVLLKIAELLGTNIANISVKENANGDYAPLKDLKAEQAEKLAKESSGYVRIYKGRVSKSMLWSMPFMNLIVGIMQFTSLPATIFGAYAVALSIYYLMDSEL